MGKETLKETLSKTAAMAPFGREAPSVFVTGGGPGVT